jgi:hypothetical protein
MISVDDISSMSRIGAVVGGTYFRSHLFVGLFGFYIRHIAVVSYGLVNAIHE